MDDPPSAAAQKLCFSVTTQLAQLDKDKVTTKNGWLLADAVRHLAAADGGSLVPLMNKHGLPQFYTRPAPEPAHGDCPVTYLALCRAIVGQQLAGAAVRKIWGRFEEQFGAPAAVSTPCKYYSSPSPSSSSSALGRPSAALYALASAMRYVSLGCSHCFWRRSSLR